MEPLLTERLLLRAWTQDDLDDAIRLWGDARVMSFLGGPLSRPAIEERLAREIDNQRNSGLQYWKVISIKSGEMVGCCGLRPPDSPNSPADEVVAGFHLVPKSWGQGYATEAATAVMRYAFDQLRLPRLYAGHHPSNRASEHVLTKLGFSRIGNRFYPPTGLNHPWYQIVNAR